MDLLEYVKKVNLNSKSEVDRAKLLGYFYYKNTGGSSFSLTEIIDLMIECGYSQPNKSRLRDKLTKSKNRVFLEVNNSEKSLKFIRVVLQSLNEEYGSLWSDTVTIESNSELIDETKFCERRDFLNKVIKQINHTYANNCYDACAVMMRRLFETLLVMAYQNLKIDDQIKEPGGKRYKTLDGIVKNAKNNTKLELSPNVKRDLDKFRELGNFSGHNIRFNAAKRDIDAIKFLYRVMLEELYYAAGLFI